jgi:hypothetical protein
MRIVRVRARAPNLSLEIDRDADLAQEGAQPAR